MRPALQAYGFVDPIIPVEERLMAKARYTRDERRVRDAMLFNLAQHVSYRVRRYNECDDHRGAFPRLKKRC